MKQQKICIIGNGLAGLITAAVLSREDIKIDLDEETYLEKM